MAIKADLGSWIVEALAAIGEPTHHVRIAEYVWLQHEADLRRSGDLFYTWQYDLRWAAQYLRQSGALEDLHGRRDGIWGLAKASPAV